MVLFYLLRQTQKLGQFSNLWFVIVLEKNVKAIFKQKFHKLGQFLSLVFQVG